MTLFHDALVGARHRVIRDPLYGYVRLPEELTGLVDAPLYQRLRRVTQTALASAVYPSATGTRLEHSLGVMFLAGRAWNAAWGNAHSEVRDEFRVAVRKEIADLPEESPAFAQEIRLLVMAVGLLHDLGHPPFSHALEPAYKEIDRLVGDAESVREALQNFDQFHEAAGAIILETFMSPHFGHPAFARAVREVYFADPGGRDPLGVLHSLVVGDLDVDRLDYLMRDGQRAGTEFGAIDWERLVDALQLRRFEDGFRIAPTARARSAAETLMVQRTQAYRWILFHHRVVATNLALLSAFETLLELAQDPEPQSVGNQMVYVSSIFTSILANFNFLAPGEESLATLGPTVATLEGQTSADRLFSDALSDVAEHLAASVDDSAVTASLLAGRNLAEALRPHAAGNLAERLELLISYVDAAFFRSKNFLSVWRAEDDFAATAERIAPDLHALVLESFAALAADGHDVDFERGRVEALWIRSRETPATFLNWVLTNTLAYRDQRDRFEALLQKRLRTLRGRPGIWRCAYVPFKAVSRGRKAPVLWVEDEPQRLERFSALVRGLRDVEGHLSRIGVFFFLRAPQTVDWETSKIQDARALLLGGFLEVLPQFVADELPNVLGKTLDLPNGGEE